MSYAQKSPRIQLGMNQNYTMKTMLEEERPYEKCLRYGAAALTDAELLAVLLRSGTKGESVLELSRRLLYRDKDEPEKSFIHLQEWTKEELLKIHGIGNVKAIQILCLCELSKRMSQMAARSGLDFSNPDTIAKYYMEEMRHLKQEVTKLVLLNTRCKLIRDLTLTCGTVNMSLISPREVFVEALKSDAVNMILLHNHPSGDPSPSKEDIQITRRIHEVGRMVGIELLDHIIIGDNEYCSLAGLGVFLESFTNRGNGKDI